MSRDNVLNVLEETEQKRELFLTAWKRGVDFLGQELFGPGELETAKDKDQLRPRKEMVEAAMLDESCGEEQFLAAMVSFFDPAWGAELAERIECDKSLCGLTFNLDHERIDILCALLRNYQGWS
ncbi:MAG TPA: hypothetical protein VJ995_10165 [Geothermobacteraceae bacterium]|nr:hypothetical protein [Geothermobacteraceae bacterium]